MTDTQTTTRKPELGSISSGTMRPQDLIPRFIEELKYLGTDPATLEWPPADAMDNDDRPWWQSDDAGWLLDELFDRLDELAPDYCYFGAHEGDGSDYGFWISWDSLDDAVHDGEVTKIDDWSEAIEAGTYLQVNDHGNTTLAVISSHRGKVKHDEIWSIV